MKNVAVIVIIVLYESLFDVYYCLIDKKNEIVVSNLSNAKQQQFFSFFFYLDKASRHIPHLKSP